MEFDETSYCVHQKQSDGIEYRNVKSDDNSYVIIYRIENGIEEIFGISELSKKDGVETQVFFVLA